MSRESNLKILACSLFSSVVKPGLIGKAPGYRRLAFTTNTCSHIIDDMRSSAMALPDEVLPAGIIRR
ncbi:hypothetical protein ACFLYB_03055 [Chloroflexota bacterium]